MGFSIHDRRRLGRTGLMVSPVGLGGVYLGKPDFDAEGSDEQAQQCVLAALRADINLIDTSGDYLGCKSEENIGLALREWMRGGGKREDVVIATKTDNRVANNFTRDGAMRSVERSLRLLQTEYLDVVSIHDPLTDELNIALGPNGTLEGLKELKEQGVVKNVGLGVRDHAFHVRCILSGDFDVCLTYRDYNLINQSIANRVLLLAAEHDVGIFNGTPVIRGLLAGADPLEVAKRPPPDIDPRYVNPYIYSPDEVKLARSLWEFARDRGIGLLALNLQYCLRERRIASTILGASSAREIMDDVEAISVDIPDYVWRELREQFGI